MELTFNRYQLTLTVRIRQPKNKTRNKASRTRWTAPDRHVRYHHLLSCGGTQIAPTR